MDRVDMVDVVIIGAGASGLMCAAAAGQRGRRVVVVDAGKQAGRKVLMSGGGRCNFSNYHLEAQHFLSHNHHFCKSALKRFSQWDVIDMMQRHHVAYAERDHGQLFCVDSAKDILDLLLKECRDSGVEIRLGQKIVTVERCADGIFELETKGGVLHCRSLVVATGGLSIPSAGASPFGYQLAEQFGIKVWPTRPGLVPLTLQSDDKAQLSALSGIAVDAEVTVAGISFRENLLFTHRGLSGPVILQISSYWQPGQPIVINLLPELEIVSYLETVRSEHPKRQLRSILGQLLPKRVVTAVVPELLGDKAVGQLSVSHLEQLNELLHSWRIVPNGTEGYRTAEVTLGGVDCNALSSKTFESRQVGGLFFVGEVVDVVGWLGGYNLQWAWSSGWCAGQYV
ncbi:MAG: NAD(P)/FAD-dependent oxidoreductase [Desulfuromonas sp.]|nr:NAD(P)/FAD-dependent oxidoreductase [Desulfuromonas sp.]